MNKLIAYCGLDCEQCEARIATVNHDAYAYIQVAMFSNPFKFGKEVA